MNLFYEKLALLNDDVTRKFGLIAMTGYVQRSRKSYTEGGVGFRIYIKYVQSIGKESFLIHINRLTTLTLCLKNCEGWKGTG